MRVETTGLKYIYVCFQNPIPKTNFIIKFDTTNITIEVIKKLCVPPTTPFELTRKNIAVKKITALIANSKDAILGFPIEK